MGIPRRVKAEVSVATILEVISKLLKFFPAKKSVVTSSLFSFLLEIMRIMNKTQK